MNNKTLLLSLIVAVAVGVVGYSYGAFAFQGNPGTGRANIQKNVSNSGQGFAGQGQRGQGKCAGGESCGARMNQERGQNKGGNFVDANGDGKCDRL